MSSQTHKQKEVMMRLERAQGIVERAGDALMSESFRFRGREVHGQRVPQAVPDAAAERAPKG